MRLEELLVTFIVALVVLGPKRVQQLAWHCGRLLRELRGHYESMHSKLKLYETPILPPPNDKNDRQ